MKLYKWQKECLKAWEENGRHGIVHVVTGAGKTFLALAAIERVRRLYPDLAVRIVVPTIPLARQWERELLHHLDMEMMHIDMADLEDTGAEVQDPVGKSLHMADPEIIDETVPDPLDEGLHMSDPEAWRPGFFGGGSRDDPDRHVMIYIVNSARDSLAGHIRRDLALKRHVLLICDECHHYQSKENRKIFGFLDGRTLTVEGIRVAPSVRPDAAGQNVRESLYFSLGLSATPFGTPDDAVLVRALGKEIYRYGFDAAVREGIISPFTVCEVSASFFADELAEYAELSVKIGLLLKALLTAHPDLRGLPEKEFMKSVGRIAREAEMDPEEPACAFLMLTYERKKITNLAQARNACCLSILERLTPDDRVLVFCERISQAEEMGGQIRRKFGNVCGIYHSEMNREARTRILGDFREGRIRILVSCRCLDEGIDVPDANIGIVMSSTAVERQRIQRLGRVIRRAPGKAAACLYYIYIRESSDDAAFLPDLEECDSFHLRYYSAEGVFSNALYEYVAAGLVRSARAQGYLPGQMEEFRLCLTEGLTRADYLLPEEEQKARAKAAQDRHGKNYWNVACRVGRAFRK